MSVWEKVVFAAAIIAWAAAFWSLYRAVSLGKMAADELTGGERHNYLVNLVLFPSKPSTTNLLKRDVSDFHSKAIAHARTAHYAALCFVLFAALALAASLMRHGLE